MILNIIEGSDSEEEDEYDLVVPRLKTVTRHGRIAGTWQRHFKIDYDSNDDVDNNEDNDSDKSKTESESEPEPEPSPKPPATRSRTRIIKQPSRFC